MTQTNWTSLGKPTVTIKSSPSLGQNSDGRLEVFTIGSDGTLWHIWQTIAGKSWSNWNPLNKPLNTNALVMPGVGKNADGRLEVFTIASDGALWHIWQASPGQGPWSNWFSSGQPVTSLANAQFPPSMAQNADGRLEAFTVGTDGALWHIYQVAPNGTWSSWTPRGKPPNLTAINAPFVDKNADGRLEAFTIGSDGALWHIWQITPNGLWSNWFSSGQPTASVRNTSLSLAVSQNLDGRLEALTIGSDGALWHIWQTTPNGTWSNWASLGLPKSMSITSPPTVEKNKDGRLEVLVSGHDGALLHIWQTVPGSVWGNWDSLGSPPNIAINSFPFVSINADGRLEAFVNGSDGALWHCWQVTPGGQWGSSTPPTGVTTATISITPMSRLLSDTFAITAVTGTANPVQRQVQARILSETSPTQSKTVPSTGSIPGSRASGVFTFENLNNFSTVTIQSTVLIGRSGVPVSFNGPFVALPLVQFRQPGFAVNVGASGNIPALDINGTNFIPDIIVRNEAAFSGGQDPQPNSIVQQSDIDGAANALSASLTPGTQAALQGQIQPREQVVPNTLACQKSNFTANHAAGDHAPNVTVTVAITCTEEVYDQQAALMMTQNLLTQKAVNELGPNYMLTGNIESTATQATVIDIHGTVSLLVQAQGTWVYTFNASDQQNIKNHLANMSQQNALQYLTSQPGVARAQIELSNGNTLPADPAHITIVIKPVTSAPPQLTLSANALTFTTTAGNNPPPQTISITNSGSDVLLWTIAVSSPSWLKIVPGSGSIAPQESIIVTFVVDVASFTPGTSSTMAIITPTSGTPETVAVIVEVT